MTTVKESTPAKTSDQAPTTARVSLIIALVLPLAAATLGARATDKSVYTWYRMLRKPAWTPPSWIFGSVWTMLYPLMGLASWLIWRSGNGPSFENGAAVEPRKKQAVAGALTLYGIHLVFNVLWSVIFFGQRNIKLALAELVVLWGLIAATMLRFYQIKPLAGLLLAPYLLWATFAGVLNATIWRMNRRNLWARFWEKPLWSKR